MSLISSIIFAHKPATMKYNSTYLWFSNFYEIYSQKDNLIPVCKRGICKMDLFQERHSCVEHSVSVYICVEIECTWVKLCMVYKYPITFKIWFRQPWCDLEFNVILCMHPVTACWKWYAVQHEIRVFVQIKFKFGLIMRIAVCIVTQNSFINRTILSCSPGHLLKFIRRNIFVIFCIYALIACCQWYVVRCWCVWTN